MKFRFSLFLVILLLTGTEKAFCFNPVTHMYIGKNTYDVWQNYDPDFYAALTAPETWVKKFYFIGLTLPDMFDTQSELRDYISSIYEGYNDTLTFPMHIEELTYEAIQNQMEFVDGAHTPNHDIEALRQMVEYAHSPDQNWSPLQKSLIYGTYMHGLHVSGHLKLGHLWALQSGPPFERSLAV